MGYTTEFKGCFKFSRILTDDEAKELNTLYFDNMPDDKKPDSYELQHSYCQWKLTENKDCLEWDREEKFYNYSEWLQWLIDNLFNKWDVELSGSVQYQGESFDDYGHLSIIDKKVINSADTKPIMDVIKYHYENDDIDEMYSAIKKHIKENK